MKRALFLAAVAVLAASTASTAAAQPVRAAPVPVLHWGQCPTPPPGSASVDGFQCATATVPVDYTQPDGSTFSLAVIKHPVQNPAERVGTLFWNPGGPSDAGTQYLPASINGFPADVLRRFDIVSWDPRGMGGRTTPVVQCFDNADQEAAFLAQLPDVPVSDAEFAQSETLRTELNDRCVQRNGDLLAHVSTADNARDLDLLRQAVGDAKTTYYGTSYGTFLGATYINMFPDKIRAAVLDGAVFPSAWAAGPGTDPAQSTFIRIGSDLGSADTLAQFIRQCGMVDQARCAFSAGSVEKTQDKWADLLARLRVVPVTVDGEQFYDRDLVSTLKSLIYLVSPLPGFDRFPGWAGAAQFVQNAYTASLQPGAPSAAATSTPSAAPSATPSTYTTSVGRQLAVICGESPNPTDGAAYTPQARLSYERSGYSGWPFVAYCAGWSARAAAPYLGPWDTPAAAPVVVVGNTFDPATPYASSQRTAQELADGHLITVRGVGHTELLNPSRCAQDLLAAYLIDGTVPPRSASCPQDSPPFPPAA